MTLIDRWRGPKSRADFVIELMSDGLYNLQSFVGEATRRGWPLIGFEGSKPSPLDQWPDILDDLESPDDERSDVEKPDNTD